MQSTVAGKCFFPCENRMPIDIDIHVLLGLHVIQSGWLARRNNHCYQLAIKLTASLPNAYQI